MKNLMIILLVLVTFSLRAQDFEGTVKWSMKMDITDPEMKEKMAEADKKMADPETQAKMKEMQAQMNNPQMKALMESNPQMKAQMERMMAGAQSGGGVSSAMPTGFTIKIKDGNTLTLMEGGMTDGMEMLYLKDKNESYSLDRQNKTWSSVGGGQKDDVSKSKVKVTKTSETMTILNHKCTKYVVEVTDNGRTTNQIFWTTTEIKDMDMKSMAKQRMSKGSSAMYYEGMEGMPLRMEMGTEQGSMTMEVTDIVKGSLNASDFKIPSDFKESKGMGMYKGRQ